MKYKIIFIIIYFLIQTTFIIPFLSNFFKEKLKEKNSIVIKFIICVSLCFVICFFSGIGAKTESCGETFTYNGDNQYLCTPYTNKQILNNRILQSLVFSIGLVIISNYSIELCSELMKLKNKKE